MDLKLSTLISEEKIQQRVKEIGLQLTDRFKNQEVVAVCVLKGSFIFYADLVRHIDSDLTSEFFGCSSYGMGSTSTGQVKLTLDISSNIEGQNVLIIEDIVDTGLTLNYLVQAVKIRKPKTLTTISLLHKPDAKKVDCQLDIVGFKIPNDFVVGYGLDYQGMYRNLPYIAQVQNIN